METKNGHSVPGLFKSFWMGGFESACHLNTRSERLDMLAATQHDVQAFEDYELVRSVGIRTVRDGIRWPRVETRAGVYDWSTVVPMVEAARESGVQVIWNLLHYGWPSDIDILSGAFVDRFARYAGAAAQVVKDHSDAVPFYVPVNEISFFAWAAGVMGYIQPAAPGRPGEIKRQLVRAAIAAMEAIWQLEPRARFAHVEPVIHVIAPREQPDLAAMAKVQRDAQFEAWDMLAGRRDSDLGGAAKYLDIVGANYYYSNQWEASGAILQWDAEVRDERWLPFHQLLREVYQRYGRPLFVAETSHFGAGRGKWLEEISGEVHLALMRGVPVEGVCLYPIIDRPDWDIPDHWHNSGLWDLRRTEGGHLSRVICEEYGEVLRRSQELLGKTRG
jgi:beta-glucosidase/6-phospho-beta-glucosidase/beta-galactosidase